MYFRISISLHPNMYIGRPGLSADGICYLEQKLKNVQLFSGRKFNVSQENKIRK
jgi:hypothetical protein